MPSFHARSRWFASVSATIVVGSACSRASTSAPATQPAPAAAAPAPGTPRPLPLETHWVRNSAEHRAIYLQVYRGATQELERQAAGLTAGTWGVILDADETVLDNSTYQKERAAIGAGFSDSTWALWLRRAEATALPGSAAFIARVKQLGGRVGIVTNRDEPFCPDTRENFRKLGITVDAVLCRTPGKDDKNPRFDALAAGTAVPGLPGFRVLMWLGDNIQDFPGLTQDIRNAPESALARFGSMYWALPNPMYGSWTSNPRQ